MIIRVWILFSVFFFVSICDNNLFTTLIRAGKQEDAVTGRDHYRAPTFNARSKVPPFAPSSPSERPVSRTFFYKLFALAVTGRLSR